MGIEYRLIFVDEYDWNYANKNKKDYESIVSNCGFDVVATTRHIIIVESHKTPEECAIELLTSNGFVFDHAYYQMDNGELNKWKAN